MSSILLEIRSRTIRYVGTRCYNEKDQPISCPISRVKLIAIAVVVGLFVIIALTLFIISKCSCNCRRRRNTMSIHYYYADPESQPTVPPAYRQFERSTERLLVQPASPAYTSTERLTQPTGLYGYLEPPSMEQLVEPAKIHPAVHPYPRF